MIENLHKNSGKTLEQWIAIVKKQDFAKHSEIAPKNAYVSLRRKKQFATLQPSTKTRFDIGINLKGQEPKGILIEEKPNSMCSHKISITGMGDIDEEVLGWIKKAYDSSG